MTESNIDILITRVVDGCATPADWDLLEVSGTNDPAVWRELARATGQPSTRKRVRLGKRRRVRPWLNCRRRSGPRVRIGSRFRVQPGRGTGAGGRRPRRLTLAFVGRPAPASTDVQPADVTAPSTSAADFLQQYMDKGKQEGRVIGELPDRKVLESTQAPDGKGYVVVFVRQIVERANVNSLYQLFDE